MRVLDGDAVASAASDLDRAVVLATNQAFNSLRSAWALAFAGYPAQALALTRLAHEYHVVLRHSRDHPAAVNDLFEANTKTGVLARELLESEALRGVFQQMRTDLNKFAHQSPWSLTLSVRPDSAGENALHLGPFVDAIVLREVGYEVLVCTTLVVGELIKWLDAADPRWTEHAVQFCVDVRGWLVTVREPPPVGDA